MTPLRDLESVCDDIFGRWDADMRPGKLLTALEGQIENYDPRVTRVRTALGAHEDLVAALKFYMAVCGNTCGVPPTRETAARMYEAGLTALAKAEPAS